MLYIAVLISVIAIEGPDPWTFAIIGDTQANPWVFKNALEDIKKRKIEFVIHLGDMAYCGSRFLWRRQKKLIDQSGLKFYYVIGNHEMLLCNTYRTPTREDWRDFWKYGWGTTFEEFRYKGRKFILLDSSTSTTPESHLYRLKLSLSGESYKSTFIFTHKPLPYPKNFTITHGKENRQKHSLHDMSGLYPFSTNKTLWNILYRHNSYIRYVFHGHYHAYRQYENKKITSYCSGGGGGRLEKKNDFYHFLLVKNWIGNTTVEVIKIERKH